MECFGAKSGTKETEVQLLLAISNSAATNYPIFVPSGTVDCVRSKDFPFFFAESLPQEAEGVIFTVEC